MIEPISFQHQLQLELTVFALNTHKYQGNTLQTPAKAEQQKFYDISITASTDEQLGKFETDSYAAAMSDL